MFIPYREKSGDNRMVSEKGEWEGGLKGKTSTAEVLSTMAEKCQDIFCNWYVFWQRTALPLLKRNIYLFHDQFGGSHSDWNSLWFKSFQYFLIIKITPKYKKKANDKIQINMNWNLADLLKSSKQPTLASDSGPKSVSTVVYEDSNFFTTPP